MLFNSFQFLVFFIIVTTAYFVLPHKYRWFLLLGSSCYFYMVFVPIYILILCFTIVVDYFAGILLETSRGNKRKYYLIASLIANIGMLAIFKYYNFLNDNLTSLLHVGGYQNPIPHLSILLPIGLSFHTFQAMSYTIEVYYQKQKAERKFGIFALYVMYYPQLVAGPIERPQHLLHQFYEEHYFDYNRVTDGLKLMVWGLFQKVVIADRIAVIVDNVYNNPYEYQGISLILATVLFSFQIYCDFSGYSDIAIGASQVMGITIMKNFNRPYQSKSIREFWGRWHISLSTWFRDYLYISIGGNRVSIPRWYFNLFIVFLISGLWHGANWTFVIWGALHGFYMVFGLATKSIRAKMTQQLGLNKLPRFSNALKIITTFFLVTFAWIFFRANSISIAFFIIKRSITGLYDEIFNLFHHLPLILPVVPSKIELLIGIIAIALMEAIHVLQNRYSIRDWIRTKPAYMRWGMYYAIILLIIFFGVFENRQFIYFQF